MGIEKKNAEIIREALAAIQKAHDLLNQLKRTDDEEKAMQIEFGPWMDAEDLAYSMSKDTQVELGAAMAHLSTSRGLYLGRLGFAREARRYLDEMEAEFDEENDDDLDLDEYPEHDPLIFPSDVPPEDMKIIRDLAKVERDHIALARRADMKDISDILKLDEVTSRKLDQLMKKGAKLREQLLEGQLASVLLDFDDDVEDMKKMASHLFFLYAAERQRAERVGKDPDEDFYYAGNNLYKFAVVAQIQAEDEEDEYEEEDWDDEDPDGGDEDE